MSSSDLSAANQAAASGFFGAVAEYYDFALYAPASVLFFGPLFFTPFGTTGARLAALASFTVAYLARPLGAIIFGQLGDRIGRKKVMFLTLALMGSATTLIGLLPTYDQAGWVGPVFLVVLRILQGLSAGVEQSGSGTLSAEHAPKNRRSFYTSWTMIGVAVGWFLGPAVLSYFAQDTAWLLNGGWRYPFLLSLPLVLVALWIRWRVPEPKHSPVTTASSATLERLMPEYRFPLLTVLRHYPWRLFRVIGCSLHMLVGVTFNVFVLGYATNHLSLSKSGMLAAISFAGLSTAFLQPLWAWLSDLCGRKVVFIGSCLAITAGLPIVFLTLQTGNFVFITLTMTLFYVAVMAGNVVQASFYPEMFPAQVRLTGVSVGTQLGLVIVGLSPLLYESITLPGIYGFWPGCVFAGGCWLIAAACAASTSETAPAKASSNVQF